MNILLSAKSRHSKNLLSGDKAIELRKTLPGFTDSIIYIYESGKEGRRAIVGKFIFGEGPLYISSDYLLSDLASKACISDQELKDYIPFYTIPVTNPQSFKQPILISSIGLTRPPQSWQYLTDDQCSIIERLAKGNSDLLPCPKCDMLPEIITCSEEKGSYTCPSCGMRFEIPRYVKKDVSGNLIFYSDIADQKGRQNWNESVQDLVKAIQRKDCSQHDQ